MKILHTSDWHLGHAIYNYDRTEEQTAMLEQIIQIVGEQKPDVFLLCGDVYHTSQPSAAVQTMFTESLVKIHDANPEMTIIVTAGNHDSGTKHDIFRTPWRALKVHTIGNVDKECVENHIVEIPGKGFVAAVPYCSERNIPNGFFQELLNTVRRYNTDNLPVVMTAHTTVRGCDFTGHENATEYVAGGIDSLDIEQLGEGYDYLALGHIHHAQFVHTGKHNARYSGTPLPVSFDERFTHTVSLVEIKRHNEPPTVKTIEIENPHPFVTLPTEGATDWEEAKELLRGFPDNIPAYIRLNVEVDDFLPVEAYAEAAALTKDKQCKFCHINAKRKTARQAEATILTVEEFQSESPLDIARKFADDSGTTFDEEMDGLFKEVVRMIEEDERNQ
ncbi:MAG: exonuclease SbcCD subunit D [Bacteroides sp.]|nr:exonuclease SbcCD subunit D [Roseburia sp.]MCM1347600.1 exonuclease SbcCD subunit D [Bacteroides sp.]MCM1421913.1 exonuclease SbcCD subunit D [Bacteroides sp.]